jgi:hypothetical protein
MRLSTKLTKTAEREAVRRGLTSRLEGLVLDAWVARGDQVELETADGSAVFVVHARRIRVAADAATELVVTLDYPLGPGGR